MSRMTKIELAQALQARNTELEAARLRIAELEGDVAALKAQAARQASAVRGAPTRSAYVPRPPSDEQLAFRELMARCKELNMQGVRARIVGRELVVQR